MRGRLMWLLARPDSQTFRVSTGTDMDPVWTMDTYLLAEIADRLGINITAVLNAAGADATAPDPVPRPNMNVGMDLEPAATIDDIKSFFGALEGSS